MHRCLALSQRENQRPTLPACVTWVLAQQGRILEEGSFLESQLVRKFERLLSLDSLTLAPNSTLYLSFEPSYSPESIKTILSLQLSQVIVGGLHPNSEQAGLFLTALQTTGLKAVRYSPPMAIQQHLLPIYHFHQKKRPYLLLKYAQSQDGFMGQNDRQIWLTNIFSKRLVHRWRSETNAILVGTNTALLDNPRLTNRYFAGKQALRIVLDRNLRLPQHLHIFDDQHPTWIITAQAAPKHHFKQTQYFQLDFEQLLPSLLELLHHHQILHLTVEGGAQLLQYFIATGYWDEARIFSSQQQLKTGIAAPQLQQSPRHTVQLLSDQLQYYFNENIGTSAP
ncbi:MAG: dihydrofolate reductase family protein [Saprospiraceae bacterium]